MDKKILQKVGHSKDHVHQRLEATDKECRELRERSRVMLQNQEEAELMRGRRKVNYQMVRRAMTRGIERNFSLTMQENGLDGMLGVSHKAKTLAVNVGHLKRGAEDEDEDAKQRPLSNLSGGERSKALVCLILAMWDFLRLPFRCLDEWDVYLDEVTRARVEHLLYKTCVESGYQVSGPGRKVSFPLLS